MDIGNLAEWVSFAWAVVSGVFMAIAWVRSNLSKAAKEEAADAARRAEEQTQAAKELAEAAKEQAAEAQKQAEATQRLADSLQKQVDAAEKAASESERLATAAEKSNQLAEGRLAESKRIADSLHGPDFKLLAVERNSFALTYAGASRVQVQVENYSEFFKLSGLEETFTLHPGQQVQFSAFGTGQRSLPSNLILRIDGQSETLLLPLVRSS